ncbi:MAG: hypothetical protein ACREXP_25740, partial [Steroidobacteraceae bacterium]
DDDGVDYDEEDDEAPPYRFVGRVQPPVRHPSPSRKAKALTWREQVARLNSKPPTAYSPSVETWPPTRGLLYVIDTATASDAVLHLDVLCRDLKQAGGWSKPKPRHLQRAWLDQLPDTDDRYILAVLAGASPVYGQTFYGYESMASAPALSYRYGLTGEQPRLLLPVLCRTGRCHLRLPAQAEDGQLGSPLTWQEGEPWQLRLEVRRLQKSEHYELTGLLRRGDERMDATAPLVLHGSGILFTQEWAAPCEPRDASNWIRLLRQQGPLRVPVAQSAEFLAELYRQRHLPPLDLPEELRYDEIVAVPSPRLTIKANKNSSRADHLRGELSFDYDGSVVTYGEPGRAVAQHAQRRLLLRDLGAENAAERRLHPLSWRWGTSNYMERKQHLELAARHLPLVVRELTAEGWHVEAEGKIYRSAARFDISVSSGVDWFELHAAAEFGETQAQLPDLLAALRRGETIVKLGDGSFGVLPEQWLK